MSLGDVGDVDDVAHPHPAEPTAAPHAVAISPMAAATMKRTFGPGPASHPPPRCANGRIAEEHGARRHPHPTEQPHREPALTQGGEVGDHHHAAHAGRHERHTRAEAATEPARPPSRPRQKKPDAGEHHVAACFLLATEDQRGDQPCDPPDREVHPDSRPRRGAAALRRRG